jgi:hypothetical protein
MMLEKQQPKRERRPKHQREATKKLKADVDECKWYSALSIEESRMAKAPRNN